MQAARLNICVPRRAMAKKQACAANGQCPFCIYHVLGETSLLWGAAMIELRNAYPKNREHVSSLLAFCKEIIAICHEVVVSPLLTGSLAVFGYTQNQAISVNDIDLACSEREFPRLSHALAAKQMMHELKAWHVLQVRKEGLKVEFDSIEYWLADVPIDYTTLIIDGYAFNVVSLSTLRELYRRGLEAGARQCDAVDRTKYAALAEKYALLCAV
jgi:hypothetical protein